MKPAARALVRPFETADRAAVEGMAREQVDDGTVFPFEDVAGVMDYWLGPKVRTYVAELDGEAVGSFAIKPNQADRGSHVANIGYMVLRARRGQGIGELLGCSSIEVARELGYRAIQFNFVVATNPAVKLWQKLGFRIVGTLPGAFRHARLGFVDAHVMFLEL